MDGRIRTENPPAPKNAGGPLRWQKRASPPRGLSQRQVDTHTRDRQTLAVDAESRNPPVAAEDATGGLGSL
jgi:hypothetical protein